MPAHGPAPTILGDGFLLTPPLASDAARILEACTESDAVESLNVPQPYTGSDSLNYLEQARRGDGAYFWAVRVQEGGELVGMVKLSFDSLPSPSAPASDGSQSNGSEPQPVRKATADIGGIYLLPSHRGRGLATRVTRLVATTAFQQGFEVLEWECLAANTSSVAVAERIGFRFYKDGWSSSQYQHHQGKAARWARMEASDLR